MAGDSLGPGEIHELIVQYTQLRRVLNAHVERRGVEPGEPMS